MCNDENSQLELQMDASVKEIEAMLLFNKKGESNIIVYISRKLSESGEKYHTNELECLALVCYPGLVASFCVRKVSH